jgi:DNA (cytosine-5)-methyltransferase 1
MGNRFGSLFTGIAGMDKGLEDAGWECTWQVEIDPYCTAVLEKHWPRVPRFGDITEVDFDEVPAVDLLAGGFPCQPVSYAGKGKAQADHRWLWPEFARAIRALRPRFVLVENVPGLRGRGLDTVLGDLTTLGYDAEWHCIPASALGAPHRRDRIWIVAYPQRQRGPGWGGTSDVAGETRATQGDGEQRERGGDAAHDRGPVVAHTHGEGWVQPEGALGEERGRTGHSSETVAHAYPSGLEVGDQPLLLGQRPTTVRDCWGLAESPVGRAVDGPARGLDRAATWEGDTPRTTTDKPPHRVARLRALGNAVVPVCAEWIGRQLLEDGA